MGLTKYEAKAYETLIKFGKLSASEISRESSVPYSRIYDVLASLTQKGLVKVIPEKTKKYSPGDTEALLKILKDKEESLKKIKEKVTEMKQFFSEKKENPIVMGVGQKAFYKLVEEMKKNQKQSYAIKWSSEYKGDWVEKLRDQIRKKKDVKVLTRYDEETKNNVQKWYKIHKNIRKFDNEGVAISITDEEVLISLIKSNVTLLIRDIPFVKIMKRLFLDSYNNAEQIK